MKKYIIVLAVVLPFLALILFRSLSTDHFRNDAARWAGPSINATNIITAGQLNTLEGKVLLVKIDDQEKSYPAAFKMIEIPANSILDKQSQKKLHGYKGNIILVSDDPALSARIWMLLSQMGYANVYILGETADNETLKYQFRPDSATGPEL
jgi:hypothetical protein